MVWLDLDVKPTLNTGTPSVEAHSSAVEMEEKKITASHRISIILLPLTW